MEFSIPSQNTGLKTYEMLRNNDAYRFRENLLKKLFQKYGNTATQDNIYEDLQGIDWSNYINLRKEDLYALKDLMESMPDKWKSCFMDTGYGKWWKFSAECADQSTPQLSDLALIKVYVSPSDDAQVADIYCQAVQLLLLEGSNRFHSKVSRIKRKDCICFWVSRTDFDLLERHFADCSNIISGAIPFVAYRGSLGISRELSTFDSHSSLQADLISSYFRSLGMSDEVDLGEMYSLLVKAWNRSLQEEHPVMRSFHYSTAQGILLLLDTMDLLTGKTVLNDDHIFLQENGSLWRALGFAHRWEEVEKFYDDELKREAWMRNNE